MVRAAHSSGLHRPHPRTQCIAFCRNACYATHKVDIQILSVWLNEPGKFKCLFSKSELPTVVMLNFPNSTQPQYKVTIRAPGLTLFCWTFLTSNMYPLYVYNRFWWLWRTLCLNMQIHGCTMFLSFNSSKSFLFESQPLNGVLLSAGVSQIDWRQPPHMSNSYWDIVHPSVIAGPRTLATISPSASGLQAMCSL